MQIELLYSVSLLAPPPLSLIVFQILEQFFHYSGQVPIDQIPTISILVWAFLKNKICSWHDLPLRIQEGNAKINTLYKLLMVPFYPQGALLSRYPYLNGRLPHGLHRTRDVHPHAPHALFHWLEIVLQETSGYWFHQSWPGHRLL